MSRIGNNPVKLPPKVEVTLGAGTITVKGPLGTLTRDFGSTVTIEKDGEQLAAWFAKYLAKPGRRRAKGAGAAR